MIENLVRGKRKDNGKWVEGYYAKANYYLDETEMHIIFSPDLTAYPRCEFSSYEEVVLETVGRFTGLTDKNGKKIFEGDIVTDGSYNMPVKFGRHKIHCCGCCFTWHDAVGFYADDGDEHISSYEDRWDDLKVIGNIYDNPELLEVDQ